MPVASSYGDDPSQLAELTLPYGTPRGVVVVIHGGFWKAAYDLSLGRPLAADLVERGWAALNVEYRRVGNGGGVPQTLDDVRAAIATLGTTGLDLGTVVTLGHSAGGHLATWAGHAVARGDPRGAQAGVLDLVAADREGWAAERCGPSSATPPARATWTSTRVSSCPLGRTGLVHARADDDTVPVQPVRGVRRRRPPRPAHAPSWSRCRAITSGDRSRHRGVGG